MRLASKYLSRINLDVFQVGVLVWLIVVLFGYFDLRVNNDSLYGGEHNLFAANLKGMDFKAVYGYGTSLRSSLEEYLKAINVYPPFVTVTMLPLTYLSEDTAYHVYAFMLLIFMFVVIYVCLIEGSFEYGMNNVVLSFAILLVLFNTYPVNFSIERGNSDITAAVFAALAILGMSRGRLFWSVIFLTISIQFKIYPMVLAILLFVRFGWKSIVWLTLINFISLFVLGIRGLENFHHQLLVFANRPFFWVGNHSVSSYIDRAVRSGVIDHGIADHLKSYALFALLLSAGLAATRYYLISLKTIKLTGRVFKSFSASEIGVTGTCFCLMSLLPSTSHDYKLVIHFIPFLLLLTRRASDLFDNVIETYIIVMLISASVAFLFIPIYPMSSVGYSNNAFKELLQMKTSGLLVAFMSYLYLSFRGKSAAFACQIHISPTVHSN